MSNDSEITLIIPVFNAEKYIIRCLDSVKLQNYKNFEVILINDGSTDNSENIILDFMKSDNRFRYFTQSNAGPSSARNLGIKEAKGKYLAFIDADDWLRPDYLEKLVTPMQKPIIDLVCAGYYEVNRDYPKGLKLHDFQPEVFTKSIDKRSFQANLFNGVSGVLWGKLFRKEIFLVNNIEFHPNLRLSEDLLAVIEYSLYLNKVFIIPDAIYFYNRLNETGLSQGISIEKYHNLKCFFRELGRFREELDFLDLDLIKLRRKYSFIIQLLKDQSSSKREYYNTAQFLVENEKPFDPNMFPKKKIDNFILRSIYKGNYYRSWIIVRLFQTLKRVKAGWKFF
ncbi:glycosyltransferase family 2 protein [Salegentibacter sp. BDJ18]|uniref:glycosyltransferase family 2 protein n=1 Tax=Salegentibacter sp. BDJ18 TaxID=2816376 RepID=UPI001AAEC1D0|nr:glycosyltransferase family 2 protein [Salegentibacter sp. BDJ18]MBO2544803.1 glycosyltransferase family 2 protein [Salegentibacter sp. BDJ18]